VNARPPATIADPIANGEAERFAAGAGSVGARARSRERSLKTTRREVSAGSASNGARTSRSTTARVLALSVHDMAPRSDRDGSGRAGKTARSARENSFAEGKRSAGSSATARRTISSSAGGTPDLRDDGGR
jgi:hypothetical protein